MASVTNSAGVSTSYGSYNSHLENEIVREPKSAWDQDMFLKVLVAQMSNQDPMNPQTDNEFIGQMAQFSSLEQMTKLNSSMTQMQAYNLVGKYVSAEYENTSGEGENAQTTTKTIQGKVDSTFTQNGITYVVINNPVLNTDGTHKQDDKGNYLYDTYKIPMEEVDIVSDPSVYNDYGTNAAIISKLNELIALMKEQQKATGTDSGTSSGSGSDSSTSGGSSGTGTDGATSA